MDLRPYQKEDVAFLAKLDAAGCFNEQRTGKTPTALKVIEAKGLKKVVIIVPSSAIYNWKEEYERWLGRPCLALIGTAKKRAQLLETWTDGLVVSYDTFKMSKRTAGLVREIAKLNPEMIILDEAHRIKARKNERASSVLSYKNFKHKLALTGTPAPGKLEEIFAILQFLYPKDFKSYWNFVDEYFSKELKYGAGGRRYYSVGPPNQEKIKELQEYLDSISTQRKRKDVMPWLPEKDYTQIKLPATKQQEKYLDELATIWETEHVVTQGTLDRLIRYRQICLDPKLLDLKGDSPKTEWIKDYLTDYPEEQIIIFSRFTSYLLKLNEELKEKHNIAMLIGATSLEHRKKYVDDFQAGKIRILLINTEVGKEALTLDNADTEIFTDKYPPIGDILQAEDRFVATTKAKANKLHKIYELMIKNTYDEQLYKLLAQRKSETDILNDYNKYLKERSKGHGK